MNTLVKSRRGRPAQTVHGTISGGNPTTGETIAWSDGSWHGTKRLVAEANYLCKTGEVLPLPNTDAWVASNAGNPVAVYAVIATLVGPRGRIEGSIPTDDIARLAAIAMLDPDDLDGNL